MRRTTKQYPTWTDDEKKETQGLKKHANYSMKRTTVATTQTINEKPWKQTETQETKHVQNPPKTETDHLLHI